MIKSIAILLGLAIILLVIFFNNKITTLENTNAEITQEYQQKIAEIQTFKPVEKPIEKPNYEELESLNLQLIEAKIKIQKLSQKIDLNQAKTSVLKDEMQQNKQSKQAIKSLKNTIDQTKAALGDVISSSDYKKLQELESIVKIFRSKNKKIIENNIERIAALKEAYSGVLVTGAIFPIIGAATLITYATQEIGHYCQNIKDNIALEKQLFGEIISLDENTKKNYRSQCQTDL